jgi:Flp pilus assembly protein TadD
MSGTLKWLLPLLLTGALGACQSTDLSAGAVTGNAVAAIKADTNAITASTGNSLEPGTQKSAGSSGGSEDLQLGKQHFRNANFGLAEKHFRLAVEQSNDGVEALIGLAASYDQLGRFDLADRAYQEAVKIAGLTSAILNNRGYSYYLRRDFRRARQDFQLALRKDPQNGVARKNMDLLNKRA